MAKVKNAPVIYTKKAKARCLNCKSEYTLGLTSETLNLEVCAHCHPFYTGQETLLDTAGRIEKFQQRLNKVTDTKATPKKVKTRKLKASVAEII